MFDIKQLLGQLLSTGMPGQQQNAGKGAMMQAAQNTQPQFGSNFGRNTQVMPRFDMGNNPGQSTQPIMGVPNNGSFAPGLEDPNKRKLQGFNNGGALGMNKLGVE